MTLDRLLTRASYWLGIAVMPCIALEMVIPLSSTTSLKVALAFLAATLLAGARLRSSGLLAAHLLLFASFLALGLTPLGWSADPAVRADLLIALEGLAVAPLLAARMGESDVGDRFLRDTAILLVAVASLACGLGLFKLLLLSRGVFIEAFYASDGTYPLGTSLSGDYNLFALGIIAGVASAFWLRGRAGGHRVLRLLLAALIVLFGLTILLTGSRRGLVFLTSVIAWQVAVPSAHPDGTRTTGSRLFAVGLALLVVGGLLTFALVFRERVVVIGGQPVDLFVVERLLDIGNRESLVATRLPLLEYAWNRVSGEYSLAELLMGRGFTYLAEMGRVFVAPDGSEYPHNLVLSALLHGGIPFAAALVGVIAVGVRDAVRHRGALGPLAPIFLLALAFGLTSSASFYSTEMLYFLIILLACAPWRKVQSDPPSERPALA